MSFYKLDKKKPKEKNSNIDLETWFELTSVFPDVLMINRIVLFAPVSYLENPPDRHLSTPADAEKKSKQFKAAIVILMLNK